jgi:hypothetical protein
MKVRNTRLVLLFTTALVVSAFMVVQVETASAGLPLCIERQHLDMFYFENHCVVSILKQCPPHCECIEGICIEDADCTGTIKSAAACVPIGHGCQTPEADFCNGSPANCL